VPPARPSIDPTGREAIPTSAALSEPQSRDASAASICRAKRCCSALSRGSADTMVFNARSGNCSVAAVPAISW
jgi:hypothetical protein